MQNSRSIFSQIFQEKGLIHLAYQIVQFIDLQTLNKIVTPKSQILEYISQGKTKKELKSAISQNQANILFQTNYFIREYLSKADLSMYYSFYEEPQFREIKKQVQRAITLNQCTHFSQQASFTTKFDEINMILNKIKQLELIELDQLQQLKRVLIDPSLPLPSIKRENQGMYCNSSFQLFLVGLRFPHCGQQFFSSFNSLKQKIEMEEENNFKQFFQIEKQKLCNMKRYQLMHLVRYMPYQITSKNYDDLLLQDNTMHNFIVLLFALTDVWIGILFSCLSFVNDPYYRFTQLMSRYSAFRAFVIQIEDSIGFLFQAYQTLYSDTIKDSLFLPSSLKPKYCFWRSALAKWFVKMNQFHEQSHQVYFTLLTKVRQQMLLQRLGGDGDKNLKSLKNYALCLRNNLELHSLSEQMRSFLQKNLAGSSLIEQFIFRNKQTCQSLIFDYIQYIIDLAVNEETVHWCGHSQHKLEKPFNIFSDDFQRYNGKYNKNLKDNVIANFFSQQTKSLLLKNILQADLQFLNTLNVKPVILRLLVNQITNQSQKCDNLNESDYTIGALKEVVQSQILKSQPISLINSVGETLFFDFSQRDQKLQYFNQKAMICQSIEGEQKYFFSIPPLLSCEQILIKFINTKDSSENQDLAQNSSFQYLSDDQNQPEQSFGQNNLIHNQQTNIKQIQLFIGQIGQSQSETDHLGIKKKLRSSSSSTKQASLTFEIELDLKND